MFEVVIFILGVLTGWAIFVKWPAAGGLLSDVFAVVWSWIRFLWEKAKTKLEGK